MKLASRAFYQTLSVSKEQTEGKLIYELGAGPWNIPRSNLLEDVMPKEKSFHDFEVTHDCPTLGHRVMLLNAKKLWREKNHTELVLFAIEELSTERKRLLTLSFARMKTCSPSRTLRPTIFASR